MRKKIQQTLLLLAAFYLGIGSMAGVDQGNPNNKTFFNMSQSYYLDIPLESRIGMEKGVEDVIVRMPRHLGQGDFFCLSTSGKNCGATRFCRQEQLWPGMVLSWVGDSCRGWMLNKTYKHLKEYVRPTVITLRRK
ncbi:MAG: hypothetical protein H6624_12265 [Bdellovibrionaceae bacterium]|nr:hypothetical protein [Bdellovibrionales bacterium]MCB9085117.1 hypothetical protein [Pseudobdellovibrionaceae bacterium]